MRGRFEQESDSPIVFRGLDADSDPHVLREDELLGKPPQAFGPFSQYLKLMPSCSLHDIEDGNDVVVGNR